MRVNYDKLSDVASLASTERYREVIEQVRQELSKGEDSLPRYVDARAEGMKLSARVQFFAHSRSS